MDLKVDIGLCRFCSNEGIFNLNDKNEKYSDIILECFNIFISINQPTSSLICSECVAHLRDAYSFRQKVSHAERILHQIQDIPEQDVLIEADTEPATIKIEPGSIKTESPEATIEHHVSDISQSKTDASPAHTFMRMDVFEVWYKHNGDFTSSERARRVCADIKNALMAQNNETFNTLKLYSRVWNICKKLVEKWKQAHRDKCRFLRRNIKWLTTRECIETAGPNIPGTLFKAVNSDMGFPKSLNNDPLGPNLRYYII